MRAVVPLVAVACAVILTGCGESAPVADPSTASSSEASPSTDRIVPSPDESAQKEMAFEQLDVVAGSERISFGTTAIDVPASMKASMRESTDGTATQAKLDGGDDTVIFTMQEQAGVDADAVKATMDSTVADMMLAGTTSYVEESSADWDEIGDVVVLRFDLTDESAGAREAVMIFLGNPDGSQVVVGNATALKGQLEGSDAYAALRTLRFDGLGR